jgi:hypothetical protein
MGKNVGGYDKEEKAARAYDLAALKYWGPTTTTNFPVRHQLSFDIIPLQLQSPNACMVHIHHMLEIAAEACTHLPE